MGSGAKILNPDSSARWGNTKRKLRYREDLKAVDFTIKSGRPSLNAVRAFK